MLLKSQFPDVDQKSEKKALKWEVKNQFVKLRIKLEEKSRKRIVRKTLDGWYDAYMCRLGGAKKGNC